MKERDKSFKLSIKNKLNQELQNAKASGHLVVTRTKGPYTNCTNYVKFT